MPGRTHRLLSPDIRFFEVFAGRPTERELNEELVGVVPNRILGGLLRKPQARILV